MSAASKKAPELIDHLAWLGYIQPEGLVDGSVPLILTLHDAPFGPMKKTAAALASLPCVKGTPLLLHMETFQ